MGYVAARCPNCGGDLQLDDNLEKGYCIHCGSPIYFQEAIQKVKIVGPLEIAGIAKLESLIKLIKKDLEFGMNQTLEFRDRLNRALELDPSNQYLYDLQQSEIWNAKIVDGKLVEYKGNVSKIVVPDCVKTIQRLAFKRCTNLVEIVLPRTIVDIDDNAFFKEERLTISAYKNTYAARYALVSPAFLQIIDDDEENQEHIRKIETLLSEIVAYKNFVVSDIRRYYHSKIFWRTAIPYILVALVILTFIQWPFLISTPTGKLMLALSGAVAVLMLLFSQGYTEVCRKIATKNQIMRFYKKSNDLLNPLGIVDFKYLKNIWESSNTDLQAEARHLERIKDDILKIDSKQFTKNTYVHLSFLSYVAGKRPKDLDNYI